MEKTVINIKTDKKLKQEAQEVARELGLPLGTIINAYLRELAREKRVVFSVPPTPNKQLQILLKKLRSEKQNRKNSTRLLSYEEAIEHLNSL
jgi:addiction module RelB/DinJ family antitoxin